MSRKITIELLITFFIAVIIYVLVDFNFIFLSQWDTDKIVNLFHTWLTLISAYYLYNIILKFVFKKWNINRFRHWVLVLSVISVLILSFVILIEVIFYKLYYDVSSLMNETTFFDFDLPITLVLLILGSLYFYQKYYFTPVSEELNEVTDSQKKIKANKGGGIIFIPTENIGLFYLENGIVWLQTFKGEKYHTDYTLASLLNKLDFNQFFRLNRQTIVAKNSIKGFQKLNFQKLKVELIDHLNSNTPLVTSKYNTPAFKKWLTNSA